MAKTKGKTYITTSTPEVNLKYQDPYEHKTYDFIPAKEPERMNTNPNSPGFVNDIGIGRKGGLEYVQGIGYLGGTLASRDTVIGYERTAGGPPRRMTTEDRRNLYSVSGVRPQTPAVYLYGFANRTYTLRNTGVHGLNSVTYFNDSNTVGLIPLFLFMNTNPGGNPEWRLIKRIDRSGFGESPYEDTYLDYRSLKQNVTDVLRNNGTNVGLPLENIEYYIPREAAQNLPFVRTPIVARGFRFDGNQFMLVCAYGGKLYITPFSVGIQTQDDVAINVAGMREYVNNFTETRASSEGINDINVVDSMERIPVNNWVKQTGFQAPSPLAPTKGSKGLLGNCSTAGQVVTGLVVGGAIFALYKTCKK